MIQLNTSVIETLQSLEHCFLSQQNTICQWFKEEWQSVPPPIYGSVDLRNAGFKIAPIDMNLFPAGFNNLCAEYLPLAYDAAKAAIHYYAPHAKHLLLIPESHTRNPYYWESVKVLQAILEKADFIVKVADLNQLMRKDDGMYVDDFVPDLIILNNDLSENIPSILQNINIPLVPKPELGWNQRLKSSYFQHYSNIATKFATLVGIDPWLIIPLFRECKKVNFLQQEGMECVKFEAELLFKELKEKYNEYHIPYDPFLIIKANAGTYGMGVLTLRHLHELDSLNRKQRKQMAITKGSKPVREVIIQEGIYTFETVGAMKKVAEPVLYLWGKEMVGGFYRVHKARGIDENLNAPGMEFEPMAFPKGWNGPCNLKESASCANRFYVYTVIAQLSMLAAGYEMKDILKK